MLVRSLTMWKVLLANALGISVLIRGVQAQPTTDEILKKFEAIEKRLEQQEKVICTQDKKINQQEVRIRYQQRMTQPHLRLATTTSIENTGLLQTLLPRFEEKHNCKVDVLSVGTGKALKLGERGDVDVVLVHDPKAEEKFVANGFGVDRRQVMYNDFIILGAEGDPAGIKGEKDPAVAFKKIAEKGASFVSRGDESGTHMKEKELWVAAGLEPKGTWYMECGQDMGATLLMTNEKQAYTLCDRATFLAFQAKVQLKVMLEGHPHLFNPYSVIAVNPKKHPHVKYSLARAFIEYITSAEGQAAIGNFKNHGQQLFFPAAPKAAGSQTK